MSEYQYYGFLAVDRPLDEAARAALRAISSRAEITSSSFTNEYNYGDFRGNPNELLRRWFDLHVYSGFWSSRRFAMRLPRRLFDPAALERFHLDEDILSIDTAGDNVIVDMSLDELELDSSEDESDWLMRLAPLRAAVLDGDLRFFYVLWLKQVGIADFMRDDAAEPLPGIGPLDDPLAAWSEFLRIDTDLLTAAAESDAATAASEPTSAQAEAFLRALPERERTNLLLQVWQGHDPHLGAALRRRIRDALRGTPPVTQWRSAGELRARAREIGQDRARRAAATKAAAERERQAREAAETARRRAALQGRGEAAWRDVEAAIEQRNASGYQQAVALLEDLKAIAGDPVGFARRLGAIRSRHVAKRAFLARLDASGL